MHLLSISFNFLFMPVLTACCLDAKTSSSFSSWNNSCARSCRLCKACSVSCNRVWLWPSRFCGLLPCTSVSWISCNVSILCANRYWNGDLGVRVVFLRIKWSRFCAPFRKSSCLNSQICLDGSEEEEEEAAESLIPCKPLLTLRNPYTEYLIIVVVTICSRSTETYCWAASQNSASCYVWNIEEGQSLRTRSHCALGTGHPKPTTL